MSDEDSLAEQRLMQAVILTAIADACGAGGDARRESVKQADQRAAMTWITDAGPDFRGVCELANLHPDTVRKLALDYIKSGRPFPRLHRQSHSRGIHNPLSPARVAAHAGVSTSAVRGVLKDDRGSAALKERVRRSLRELTEQQLAA